MEEVVIQEVVPEIITEVPVAPAPELPSNLTVSKIEQPELVYTYQPKDESGRALGGKQVIKYRTPEELTDRLVENNVSLIRKLREQTRRNRLGIEDVEFIPEDAPKFDAPIEFNPRQLTPDERYQLSRDLLDPDKFDEATSTLFEASVGAKPEVLRNTLSRLSQTEMALLAKAESEAFMSNNPDYYPCRENFDAITGWMVRRNLKPVRQNFQLAYDTLRSLSNGSEDVTVIVGKPVENTEVVPEPVVIPEPVVTREEIPVAPPVPEAPKIAPPASGLRDGGVTNVQAPKQYKYTLADINKMSGDEYKRKLIGEKGFAATIEALEKEAAEKGRRR